MVLALTWAPRPPTRSLRGFLEGLGLKAHYNRFVREDVDLTVMREMNEQQFERIGVDKMGQKIRLVRAAAQLTEEDLENDDENIQPAAGDEIQPPGIAEAEAEREVEPEP